MSVTMKLCVIWSFLYLQLILRICKAQGGLKFQYINYSYVHPFILQCLSHLRFTDAIMITFSTMINPKLDDGTLALPDRFFPFLFCAGGKKGLGTSLRSVLMVVSWCCTSCTNI